MFTKKPLSAALTGKGILVSDTTDTLIHETTTSTTTVDEIWLYASNVTTTARKLTVKFGGTVEAADFIELMIPGESGLVMVVPGLILISAGSALAVNARAGAANSLLIFGYVNRVTE